MTGTTEQASPANLQDVGHHEGYDYEAGSPHLVNPQLRWRMVDAIRAVVGERLDATGQARVLEIGRASCRERV